MKQKNNHMIDFLFPVVLFFVFALCAMTVLLLAANVYRETTETSSLNYTARTSLSYISEKIHQNDEDGNVYVGEFKGNEAIVMEQDTCVTYIYMYEGSLMELYARKNADVTASSGTKILDVDGFEIKETSKGLISISCTDADGQRAESAIAVRSSN